MINNISDFLEKKEEITEVIYRSIEFEIGHDRCYNVSENVQKDMAKAIYKSIIEKINK